MGAPTDVCIALVTAPSEAVATDLARAVVGEGLAACVNLLPGVRSIYRWKGAVEEAEEVLMVLKTRSDSVETLRQRVEALHPYEVPEFVVLPVEGGLDAYLSWIRSEVTPP